MISSPWGPLPGFIAYSLAAVFGASFGSFANVLIYRLPAELSLTKPPSSCPKCGRRISVLENIPILSWLFLRGKCRGCQAPISVQYPLVELASAILFTIAIHFWGVSYQGAAYGLLFIGLLALIVIDLRHWLLPFAITIPLMFVGLTGAAFFKMRPVMDSLLGIGAGLVIFAVLIYGGKLLFKKEAMGGGDLVFGMMAGAFLGWKLTFFMLFIASFLGTLIAIFMLILGKDIAGKMLPFGPFLAVAMVVSLLFGDGLISWYVGLFQH